MQDRFVNRLNMFRTVKLTVNLAEHLAVWQGQTARPWALRRANGTRTQPDGLG